MIDIPAETTISRYAIPALNLLMRCEASFPAPTPKERSAPGHSRRFDGRPATSGPPPSTDVIRTAQQVGFVPSTDLCVAPNVFLFDHPVSLCDQPCRYFEAKLFGRLEVDDQFPTDFVEKRHLRWLTAIQYFHDLRSNTPISRLQVEGVRHQRSGLDRVCISTD